MFPFRKIGLLFLVFVLIACIALPSFLAMAQDDNSTPIATDEPVLVTDANATEVVIIAATNVAPPATAPAPHETALPPDNPRGGFTADQLWEFVKPVIVILVITILGLFGTALYLAIQHIPAWLRPLLPMAKAGLQAIGDTAFATLKADAITTSYTWDEDLYAEGQKKFDDWLAGLDARAEAKLNAAIQQKASANSQYDPEGSRDRPVGTF